VVWQKAHQFVIAVYRLSRTFPFLNIAQGSLEESRYYLILTRDLDYGDVSEFG